MSKKIPYYKFFPSEWLAGDITLCSYETQGVFVSICNYYWLQDCSICLAKIKQRFSSNEANIKELLKHEIIKINNDENIIINFLDEQMNEFVNLSEKRAIAGKIGGKANAKQMLKRVKAKPSNKEKIREDKIREDNNIYKKFSHLKITIDEFDKLNKEYSKEDIDSVLDDIENYRKNTKYKYLYKTALNWLKKNNKTKEKEMSLSEKYGIK